jgi:hypothetical protein
MANKDEIDLSGLDLDDFDFGIPEWSADEEIDSSSRKPIDSVVKGTKAGLKKELASPSALRRALSMALPEGYGLAADTIENVATDARSLYDKVTGESPELVRGSKAFGRKAMNMVGTKVLPKKVADRLNNALQEDEDYSVKSSNDYRREQEENDLAGLAEIFKASAAAGEERAKRDDVESIERKAMDQARFKSNIQALSAINRSMARLVGYQDKITARYQHKMLELNYRQYATTKQLTDLMAEATSKQTQILETIRHNTALPEAVKIRGSEMFGQLAKQRLMGQGLNSVSNWTQNYGKQVMDNVSGMIRGLLDPMGGGLDAADGMGKAELGGYLAGSKAGAKVRDHAAMFIAPYLAKNKYVAAGGEKLRSTFTGLPQRINEFAQSESEGSGYRAVAMQTFKSFLPQFSLDASPGGTAVDKLDEIGTFDTIARRSLIEIIPGYLSEIAHWSRVAVTGEKDSEKKVYNVVRGGFTSEKEQLKDVQRQIMSRSERESLRGAADEFLVMIGGDIMSSKAQRVLKRKLLDELANGRDLVPKRLADPVEYPGEDVGIVDEITSLIIDSFGLDFEGNSTDSSTEGRKRFNNIRDQFLRMASMIPASGDRIRILGDVLGKDSLRKLGYIERQDRDDAINYDKIWSSVLDEDDEPGEARASKSNKDGDHRRDIRTNRTYVDDQVRGDLSDRAARADRARVEGDAEGHFGGLERFLGDKSTLITLIRESRNFHEETVNLLKALKGCGCVGAGSVAAPTGAAGRLQQVNQWTEEAISKSIDKFDEVRREAKDIWIQGEDHPRLEEWKLKAEMYRDKASGEVIKRWEDIQGDVVDLKGKTVARYTEIVESGVIADHKAKVIKRASDLLGRAKGSKLGVAAAAGLASAQARLSGFMGGADTDATAKEQRKFRPRLNRLMKFFRSDKADADISGQLSGNPKEDMVTLLMRSVQLQYETLKQVTPEKIRKGSFQDLFSRRKEMLGDAKEKIKGKFADTQGLFAKGGLLAGLMDKIKGNGGEDGNGGGGILDTLGDIGDIFGGGDSADGRTRKQRRRAGRTGKLGKLKNLAGRGLDKLGLFGKAVKLGAKGTGLMGRLGWGATKLMGKGAWGALKLGKNVLTNPLTRMVLGQGARMALGAVMGAAGLISAPVLAGAAVVGGAIVLGSYVYGAMKDKLPPLMLTRMAQYGIDPDPKNEQIGVLVELEKLFAKATSVDAEGKASINVQSVPFESVAAILKLNTTNPDGEPQVQRAMHYLRNRFSAVYLAHVSNYYALTKSLDLTQADTKLTGKVAMEFLNKVTLKDRPEVFEDMVAPFEKEELKVDAGDVEDYIDTAKGMIEKQIKKENNPEGKSASELHADALKATAAAGAVAGASNMGAKPKSDRAVGAPPGTPGAKGTTELSMNAGDKTKGTLPGGLAVPATTVAAVTATVVGGAVVSGDVKAIDRSIQVVQLDDATPVRYRVYGLTEMGEIKVGVLQLLETNLWKSVQYDKDKVASLRDVHEGYLIAQKLFSPYDSDELSNLYVWFHRRFLPAFLAFCSSVRQRANIDAQDAAKRLDPQQLFDILKETAVATDGAGISVWDIEESPWKHYVLNDDPASIDKPLDALQLKIKDKLLQEPKTANKGIVRDKDGNVIVEDPNQVNRPGATGSQGPNGNGGLPDLSEKKEGVISSMWSGFKSALGFGDKAPQQGGLNQQGQSTAPGGGSIAGGTPVEHPGGGTGGNINDIPVPKGDGWEANRETLMAAANMVGIDPALAASIAGVESGFRPNALPYRNPKNPAAGVLSSAASYYQVIKGTWKGLMAKYAQKYGINPGTTQHDPRANALLGLEYIKENVDTIKKVKSNVTDTDVYLAHFLGPGGARRFLSAPPGDPATNHVGADQAKSNPAIFYSANGRPRTVAEVYGDFDKKLKKHRKGDASQIAQSLKGGAVEAVASSEEGNAAEPAARVEDTTFALADTTMPSMVRPMDTSASPTNTVVEASSSPETLNLTERANTRQTQNSTAGLMMAARTAEVQSSTQAKAASNTYGGLDRNMERLVGVNESQLEQLITLVSLLQKGTALPGQGSKEQQLVAQAGKQTTQNPVINTPKAATRGTVSVGRV